MTGYFKWALETSRKPVEGDVEHFFLGFLVLMTPIGLPMYYVGKVAAKVIE